MSTLAWHFTRSDADGNPVLRDDRPIVVGELLTEPEAVICHRGLHASERGQDALWYVEWSDAWVWRVQMGPVVQRGGDKLVSTERTALCGVRADPILRQYARWCARQVLHLWDAPEIVRRYLETGDETIRAAAWDAATSAATSAARAAATAAWAAAWDAGRAAATAAAWAARAAARAARAAARAAAWAAARAAQNAQLESMILAAMVGPGAIGRLP